jgi:O-antigen ligase
MALNTTAKQINFLSRPWSIVLSIPAIAILWMVFRGNPTTFVLLVVAVLFLLGLKKPLWAMAAFLVSQLTLTSYMVNNPLGIPVSLRLSLLILVGLFLLRTRAQYPVELGKKARRVLIPSLVLLGITIASNLINSGFDYAFKDFRNMLVGILVIIFLPAVTRNMKDLKILCGVVFIGMTASAIIGLMQHYHFLGMEQITLTPGFFQRWTEEPRVPGMAEDELYLSFTLPIVALAVLGIFLARGLNSNTRKLLLPSAIMMAIVLYFTYTRSALMALILALPALALFLKTRIKWEIPLAVALLLLIFIESSGLLGNTFLGGRTQEAQADSSYERKVLWQAGIAIAKDNLVLGIGGDRFKTVSPQYASSVDPALMAVQEEYWEYRTLGSVEPHNDFIMVWACYGTPALLVYLWLLITIIYNFRDSYRASKKRFIKGLSIGLAAGLVAYLVNAFYHNCMAAMPLLWIMAGFSAATAKLALKEKDHTQYLTLAPEMPVSERRKTTGV